MPVTGQTTPSLKAGIEYSIGVLPGEIQEEGNTQSSTTTVLCSVAYEDSAQWLFDMMGYSQVVGNSLLRVLPEPCGFNPTQYALSYRLKHHIGPSADEFTTDGWPIFTTSVYQVTFASPLYRVLEDADVAGTGEYDRYVVWEREPEAQNEQIPGGIFKFADGSSLPDNTTVRVGRIVRLRAKWIDVPTISATWLDTMLGRVNNATLTWNGEEYDAETVMFAGWKDIPRVNQFGILTRDVAAEFLIRADGRTWNKFWKRVSGTSADYLIPTDEGGNKVFAQTDLNQIFVPG